MLLVTTASSFQEVDAVAVVSRRRSGLGTDMCLDMKTFCFAYSLERGVLWIAGVRSFVWIFTAVLVGLFGAEDRKRALEGVGTTSGNAVGNVVHNVVDGEEIIKS